ncbi:MAG: diphthine--ammonia ligase [Candidatus Altarchaeaceae archaeon]
MKIAVLYSGGKDSTLALYYSLKFHEVKFLLSFISNPESYMFHYPNIELVKFSAEASGIPIIIKKSEYGEKKEIENLEEALKELKNFGIEGIACGAVSSNYQYNNLKKICEKLNLKIYAPFWKRNHEDLIREMLNLNFKIIIVGLYADGFNEKFLGRILDENTLNELKILEKKFKINIGGEGGEYETFVLDCPIFKKEILIKEAEKIWKNDRGEFLIKKVELREKF